MDEKKAGSIIVSIVAVVGLLGILSLFINNERIGNIYDQDSIGKALAGEDYTAIGITGRIVDNTSVACTDSDGGLNNYIKGNTIGFNPQAASGYQNVNTWDICVKDSSGTFATREDFKNSLYEYGCRNGYFYSEMVTCQYGCTDGACLSAPKQTCTDTDGGDYPYTFGSVSLQNPSNPQVVPYKADTCYYKPTVTHGSSCSGTGCQVMENYCIDIDGDNIKDTYNSRYYDCPGGCSNGLCSKTVTYVPFNIGIDDTAPASDVVIATDVSQKLVSKGLIATSGNVAVGIAKLFSEIDAMQLDNRVTLAIYYGSAVIIVGAHSPAEHILFANEIVSILQSKGITAKMILSSDITSSDLKDLFIVPCSDSDNGKNYNVRGTVTGYKNINESYSYEDSCSTDLSALNEYYCTDVGDFYSVTTVDCPYTCYNGVCLTSMPRVDTGDMTPRIAYWGGKVNQHTVNGVWMTDQDGVSGADIDMLTYCKKWYPSSTRVEAYKLETFSGWCERYNQGNYTSTKQSYKCVSAPVSGSCRIVDNHLEMAMVNTIPTFAKLVITKGQTMNYNKGDGAGDWTISVLGGNSVDYSIIISVNGNTRSMNSGDSRTMADLIVILDKAEFSADGNSVTATLYVLPYSLLNTEDGFNVESTKAYCYNNNLYQKACPTTVNEDSNFVDQLVQSCTYGCINNACSKAPITDYCNDTDYDNKYKAGTVSGVNANVAFKYTDSCSDDVLTEYYCEGTTFASKQYTCEAIYDQEEACDINRCIPTYCDDHTVVIESGDTMVIDGRYGSQSFTVLDYDVDSMSVRVVMNSTSSTWDTWMVDGDRFVSNGQEFYVKDVFIWTIGGSSAALQLCYEPGQNTCIDSDNGIDYYSKGQVVGPVGPGEGSNGWDYCYTPTTTSGISNTGITGTHLLEWYCTSIGGAGQSQYACPAGCSNGVCIESNDSVPSYCDTHSMYLLEDDVISITSAGIVYRVEIRNIHYDADDYGDTEVELTIDAVTYILNENIQKTSNGLNFYLKDIFVDNVGTSNTVTANICFDIKENPVDKVTLKDFPQPFLEKGGNPNAIFIVGKNAAMEDTVGVTDIIASLQRYAGNNAFPLGMVKIDDSVTDAQLYSNNLVIVGGICANSAAKRIYDIPSDCTVQDTPGVGKIRIVRNKLDSGKYVLLVHGYNAEDTTRATRVLAEWNKYGNDFKDASTLCITGTLNDPIVKKC
ncbi:MAG: hypothetical protein ACP5OA_02525 [Candidatus Woesearchaeota archaeon]